MSDKLAFKLPDIVQDLIALLIASDDGVTSLGESDPAPLRSSVNMDHFDTEDDELLDILEVERSITMEEDESPNPDEFKDTIPGVKRFDFSVSGKLHRDLVAHNQRTNATIPTGKTGSADSAISTDCGSSVSSTSGTFSVPRGGRLSGGVMLGLPSKRQAETGSLQSQN